MIPIYGEPKLGDIVTFNEMNEINKAFEPLKDDPCFEKSGMFINEKSSLNDTISFFKNAKGLIKSLKNVGSVTPHINLCNSYIERCMIIRQMVKEKLKQEKNNEFIQ